MRFIVVGAGYVGLANAVMLAQHFDVNIIDIDQSKVATINAKQSPIKDTEIENAFHDFDLNLTATIERNFKHADVVIIATPTDYDPVLNYFDTSSVDSVIDEVVLQNRHAIIVIKSTVPVGYTDSKRKQHLNDNIIFSPEFLREGKALYDCLNPSRIVIGDNSSRAKIFIEKMLQCVDKKSVDVVYTHNSEAEAIKLFSNTYLAMRVSFFNELDSYAQTFNLNAKDIIQGVGLDDRIGMHYNNPSFGYGGYCLPKDTKQLLANFKKVPNTIISAIIDSNEVRKNFIVQSILAKQAKIIGVYRLVMKSDSDNFRSSAVIDIINQLIKHEVIVLLYEPLLNVNEYNGCEVISDLDHFKNKSDLIIANRNHTELNDVSDKTFTRDLFQKDL